MHVGYPHQKHARQFDSVAEFLARCENTDEDKGRRDVQPDEPYLHLAQCVGLDIEWNAGNLRKVLVHICKAGREGNSARD